MRLLTAPMRVGDGSDVPLCCAIARHIRGRRSVLLAHGSYGKQLLAEAELHWRLTIEETELQPDAGLTAIAALEGAPSKHRSRPNCTHHYWSNL